MYQFTSRSQQLNAAAMMSFATTNTGRGSLGVPNMNGMNMNSGVFGNTSIDSGDNNFQANKVRGGARGSVGGANHSQSHSNGALVIRPNDVLCGRGKVSFNHSGNRRFRHIISQSIDEYRAANSKWEKSLVAARLVSVIHGAGGRFLKQKKNNEDEWFELSLSESKSKVSHAIRDAIAATKQSQRPSQEMIKAVATTERPTVAVSSSSTKGLLKTTPSSGGLTRMVKPQFRGTWSSNSLVSLTDDSDDKDVTAVAKPDTVSSKLNESWCSSSSEEEDGSDSQLEDEPENFADDFVDYIQEMLGPGHP